MEEKYWPYQRAYIYRVRVRVFRVQVKGAAAASHFVPVLLSAVLSAIQAAYCSEEFTGTRPQLRPTTPVQFSCGAPGICTPQKSNLR